MRRDGGKERERDGRFLPAYYYADLFSVLL